jgi:dynein heavy chain 1, cytosolic
MQDEDMSSLKKSSNTINDEQTEALVHLSKMADFANFKNTIQQNLTEFFTWFDSSNPESNFSDTFKLSEAAPSTTPQLVSVNTALKKLLVIKAFRPDRFIASAEMLINEIFGSEFLKQTEKMIDLANIVENEIKANTPILMCSVTGFDASGHVEDLAAETNKQIISIAIGSSEGFTQAEKAINTSSKTGRWVLFEKCHLASSWLVQLEKKTSQSPTTSGL